MVRKVSPNSKDNLGVSALLWDGQWTHYWLVAHELKRGH